MVGLTACGRKGPPLPPLVFAPAAVAEFTAKRAGGDIALQFKIPTTNTDSIGPADLARVEIYAHTGPLPAPADYLKYGTLIGTIPVKAPPVTEERAEGGGQRAEETEQRAEGRGQNETTPTVEQGMATSVRETLTPALLEPGALPYVKQVPTTPPPVEVVETPGTVNLPPPIMRYYVVMGISRKNKKGAFGGPLGVPISTDLPTAPEAPEVKYTQDSLSITWTPVAGAPARFNVYQVEDAKGAGSAAGAAKVGVAPVLPANAAVLTEPTFTDKVEFGATKCYVVRTVAMIGTAAIESEPSAPTCVTPRDTFPPAAPKQLASVSDDKGVNLIWEPNTEPDFAGYIVLRGEGTGDMMKPLTPEPIRETAYRDTAVQQGRSYVYAVVAVDNATPPNQSEESNRQTEVIR